jgi:hypothetical protein
MIKINKAKASKLKKAQSMPVGAVELISRIQKQEATINNLIERVNALESFLQI